jgi:hypothetical protein
MTYRRNREGTRGDISIHLGFPISNQNVERTARLEVVDEMSGHILISVNLTGARLLELMAGQHVRAHAEVFVPRPETVGKHCEVDSTVIQHSDLGPGSPTLDGLAEDTKAEYERQGYTQVTISKTNTGGRNVTARRWIDPVEG